MCFNLCLCSVKLLCNKANYKKRYRNELALTVNKYVCKVWSVMFLCLFFICTVVSGQQNDRQLQYVPLVSFLH